MFDMCFQKTSVKTQKLVNAQIKSGMKMEIYFISDS